MDTNLDPFSIRTAFLRVGWMDRYQGVDGGDAITSGGSYVAEHGYGHEIFNFQPYRGVVYGYVQPPGRREGGAEARINLPRLGARPGDASVPGVLAVWVATPPTGGAFVVGWYRNATVHRDWQPPPQGSDRRHSGTDFGYYITADAGDAVLLAPDERVFPVPQKGKGEFGQSNIWYADDPERHRDFRLDLLRFIETRRLQSGSAVSDSHRQPDPLLKQRVERAAIETVIAHFTRLGYRVESVERDNLGWDLNAVLPRRELKLEVKGLSGSQVVVELTPNEYGSMRRHRDSYRLCVVTDALTGPNLRIFAFSPDSGRWESPDRLVLDVQEIIAARCSSI